VLGDHMAGVVRSLNGAVTAYNRAIGSLEGRVLVTARRFVEMGVVGGGEQPIPPPVPVEAAPRPLQATELVRTAPVAGDPGADVPV